MKLNNKYYEYKTPGRKRAGITELTMVADTGKYNRSEVVVELLFGIRGGVPHGGTVLVARTSSPEGRKPRYAAPRTAHTPPFSSFVVLR